MKSYGRNAERLIRAKRHYDPENIFRSAIPLPVDEAMADVALAPSGSPEDNAAVGIRHQLMRRTASERQAWS